MSLRAAIDAKCKDCIYDPLCGGGTWREQVAQCSSVDCPLWPYRPMPRSGPFAGAPRRPEDTTQNGVVCLLVRPFRRFQQRHFMTLTPFRRRPDASGVYRPPMATLLLL